MMTREENICQSCAHSKVCKFNDGESIEYCNQHLAISALRPVSREQVILCRDCRFWQGNNGGYPHPECRWGNNETPDEDDYCSFAERLEVSKNG